jgi:hypothetical protein
LQSVGVSLQCPSPYTEAPSASPGTLLRNGLDPIHDHHQTRQESIYSIYVSCAIYRSSEPSESWLRQSQALFQHCASWSTTDSTPASPLKVFGRGTEHAHGDTTNHLNTTLMHDSPQIRMKSISSFPHTPIARSNSSASVLRRLGSRPIVYGHSHMLLWLIYRRDDQGWPSQNAHCSTQG